jgi:hypothetical protein
MTTTMHAPAWVDEGILQAAALIRREYRELPGLNLTQGQIRRLVGFDPYECAALVDWLVATQALRRTANGQYVAAENSETGGAR